MPLAPKLPEPLRFRRCGQTQPLDIFTALTLRRWVQKRLWKAVFYCVILSTYLTQILFKVYNSLLFKQTNADIPYADHFYVSTHYCIVKVRLFPRIVLYAFKPNSVMKVGEGESLLTVLCDIKYKKTPWGLVKSFIEKNCWAGIEVQETMFEYAKLFAGALCGTGWELRQRGWCEVGARARGWGKDQETHKVWCSYMRNTMMKWETTIKIVMPRQNSSSQTTAGEWGTSEGLLLEVKELLIQVVRCHLRLCLGGWLWSSLIWGVSQAKASSKGGTSWRARDREDGWAACHLALPPLLPQHVSCLQDLESWG